MHLLKQRSTVFYVGFVLIMTMAIGGVAFGAFAATCDSSNPAATQCSSSTNASAQITGGPLTETGPANATATPVTLDGTNTSTLYSFDLTVTDATGSGKGWHLTMVTGQFTGKNDSSHVLPLSASTLNDVGAVCVTTCSTVGSVEHKTADLETATPIFTAALGQGMGQWTVTPSVNVTIPANTFADTYGSNVTVTLVAGP